LKVYTDDATFTEKFRVDQIKKRKDDFIDLTMNKEDSTKKQLEAARLMSDQQREKDIHKLKAEWTK